MGLNPFPDPFSPFSIGKFFAIILNPTIPRVRLIGGFTMPGLLSLWLELTVFPFFVTVFGSAMGSSRRRSSGSSRSRSKCGSSVVVVIVVVAVVVEGREEEE